MKPSKFRSDQIYEVVGKIERLIDLNVQSNRKMCQLRWMLLLEAKLNQMGIPMDSVSSPVTAGIYPLAVPWKMRSKVKSPDDIIGIRTKDGELVTFDEPIPVRRIP